MILFLQGLASLLRISTARGGYPQQSRQYNTIVENETCDRTEVTKGGRNHVCSTSTIGVAARLARTARTVVNADNDT